MNEQGEEEKERKREKRGKDNQRKREQIYTLLYTKKKLNVNTVVGYEWRNGREGREK